MNFQEAFRTTLEYLRGKRLDYIRTFSLEQPANVSVLEDLAWFCRANESCVVPGDRDKTLVLEGRREVWLRIKQKTCLTEEQQFQLYSNLRSSAPQGERTNDRASA